LLVNDELSYGKTIVKIIYLVVFKNVQISLLQQIPTRNPGVINPSVQCSFFCRVKVSGICLFGKRVLGIHVNRIGGGAVTCPF